MTSWQKFFKEKLNEIKKEDIIYDIGGGAQPQERQEFKKYIVIDQNPVYNPDIVADIQNLPFPDNYLKAVLCLSVLEHVKNPFKASEEIFRVLMPDGKALIFAPFIWPYHASKNYKDYWRFSEDGINILFKKFAKIEIVKAGNYFSTLVNFIPSFTKIDRILRPLAGFLDSVILKTSKRTTAPGYFIYLIK